MAKSFTSQLINRFYLEVPVSIAQPFYEKKQRRFTVTVSHKNHEVCFPAAIQKRKHLFLVMINKRLQQQLNIDASSAFTVQLEPDTSKYGVPMPEEFDAVLLTDNEAFDRFEALTPGRQRALIFHILKIKDTQKRVDKALMISENLKSGLTDFRLLVKQRGN